MECVTAKARAFCPNLWVFMEIPAFSLRIEFLPSAAITNFAFTVLPEESFTYANESLLTKSIALVPFNNSQFI